MSGLRGAAQVTAPSACLVAKGVVFSGNQSSIIKWQRVLCLVAIGVVQQRAYIASCDGNCWSRCRAGGRLAGWGVAAVEASNAGTTGGSVQQIRLPQ
jgi:hypothetical protein